MSIRFNLIGCGRIAQKYIQLFAEKKIQNAKIVGVCDIISKKAKLAGMKLGVPYFSDMNKMIKKTKPEVICILTPSGLHFKHFKNTIKYKKHYVIEKPIALRLKDANEIIKLSKKNNIKIFPVFQNRFNKPIKFLKNNIEKNKLGKIFLITARIRWKRDQKYYNLDKWRGTFKYDGGVIANQAIHFLDLLMWLGGDVKSVFSIAKTYSVKIETEDTAVVILKFRSGAIGVIEATGATRPNDLEGSVSVLGNKGSIIIGGFSANKIETLDLTQKNIEKNIAKYTQNPPNVYGFGHQVLLNKVVKSINKNQKFEISLKETQRRINVLQAIYQSIQFKKEIKISKNNKSKLGEF